MRDKFIEKYYDKRSKTFFVVKKNYFTKETHKFKTFKGFVKYLEGDLSYANLYDFDFKGIKLKKYEIDKIGISKKVLLEQGLFNEDFYNNNLDDDDIKNQIRIQDDYKALVERKVNITNYDNLNKENERAISYISDIHLNHKLKNKFKKPASKYQIEEYIYEIVMGLERNLAESSSFALFILGDVSFTFEIAKMFYTELKNQSPRHTLIFAILGNHELWDNKLIQEAKDKSINPITYITQKYRKLFKELGVHFFENELLIVKNDNDSYNWYKIETISQRNIISMKTETLRNKCKHSLFTVFGGLGYSGYEPKFNATIGLYRDSMRTLEEDIRRTKLFEETYQKLKLSIPNERVIITTHTPKSNWSKDEYCKNWVYLSGHTHRNTFSVNENNKVYSDNQIGYDNMSIGLKHFYLNTSYDIFDDYFDGIYEITRSQYYDFYHGRELGINYNRKNTKIHMLKKNGYYCFIQENLKTGSFCLMNGGEIKKLTKGRDLQYHFDNLELYAKAVESFVQGFNDRLMLLSKHIQSFGGTGCIHGCIVDIDFMDHVYLNPYDGKITPYYATSMVNKYIYQNIPSLLNHKRPSLMDNFTKLIASEKGKSLVPYNTTDFLISKKRKKITSTDIYKASKIIKSMQYITRNKVIRSWNDNLINNKLDKNNLMFINLIE